MAKAKIKLQTSNYKRQTTIFKFQTSNLKLQTSNYKADSGASKLRWGDFSGILGFGGGNRAEWRL